VPLPPSVRRPSSQSATSPFLIPRRVYSSASLARCAGTVPLLIANFPPGIYYSVLPRRPQRGNRGGSSVSKRDRDVALPAAERDALAEFERALHDSEALPAGEPLPALAAADGVGYRVANGTVVALALRDCGLTVLPTALGRLG